MIAQIKRALRDDYKNKLVKGRYRNKIQYSHYTLYTINHTCIYLCNTHIEHAYIHTNIYKYTWVYVDYLCIQGRKI